MKIKRTLVGIFSAFLVIIFGLGLFAPVNKAKATEFPTKYVCNSTEDDPFRYELITYSDVYYLNIYSKYALSGKVMLTSKISYPSNWSFLYKDGSSINTNARTNIELINGKKIFSLEYIESVEPNTLMGQYKFVLKEESIESDGIIISSPLSPESITIGELYFYKFDEESYLPMLDIDGNGRINILDAQCLLTYILEVQIGSYDSSYEGFYQFREDYWRERNDVL